MLPYYLRHYQPIAEKFFIYDDGSTDGSLEILSSYDNVTIQPFVNEGYSFVLNSQKMANQAWKQSRGKADWVIICNIDEHVYHPDLENYLQHCYSQGITIISAQGYQMISESFPTTDGLLCNAITRGMPWGLMNKVVIFNPNLIEEINYTVGRHTASPKGQVIYPEATEVKLLHYKYLGLDYLLKRHAALKIGLKPLDIEMKWGRQYLWDRETTENDFIHVNNNAVEVIP